LLARRTAFVNKPLSSIGRTLTGKILVFSVSYQVLSVSYQVSLFLTGVGVHVCVIHFLCLFIHKHTHIHTARGEFGCYGEARSRDRLSCDTWRSQIILGDHSLRHLEITKNPNGLNLGIYVSETYVLVYEVHRCIYMLESSVRSWTNCLFSFIYFPKKKIKRCENIITRASIYPA